MIINDLGAENSHCGTIYVKHYLSCKRLWGKHSCIFHSTLLSEILTVFKISAELSMTSLAVFPLADIMAKLISEVLHICYIHVFDT